MFSFKNSELAIIAVALEEEHDRWKRKNMIRRRTWVDSAWKKGAIEGEYFTLLPHLMDNEMKFYEYFRMTRATFQQLFLKIEGSLKKRDTYWRLAITGKERLAVCLCIDCYTSCTGRYL